MTGWTRMPSRIVLGLAGMSVASGLFAFTTRQTYRRIAVCAAAGAAAGASLTYYNDEYHCIDSVAPGSSSTHVDLGHVPVEFRAQFNSMKNKIYSHLSTQYDDLGQLELGEEQITVQEHVFAQIGVIDEDGIRNMWRMLTLDLLQQMAKHGFVSVDNALQRHEQIVFCDLGSGVGNVCLQVLAETPCNSVVGVEIIPSRHRAAVRAFENAQKFFPNVFHAKKHAHFVERDIVGCQDVLSADGVNVLFTHSWMFDDDLMRKLSLLVASLPQLKVVITSRPLDENIIRNTQLNAHKVVHFSADWNERAPFHVYFQNIGK